MPLVSTLYHSWDRVGVSRGGIKSVYDDNFVDRLSYYYTHFLLLFFLLVISTKSYVGDPIACFCPAHFTRMEVMYTNYVCWVSNTYYLPFHRPIPSNYELRVTDDNEITYYQYVPVTLLLMSFILRIPRELWRFGVEVSGIGLKGNLALLRHSQTLNAEQKEERVRAIARYLGGWTSGAKPYRAGLCSSLRQRIGNYCFLGIGRHYGNYLVSLSIFTKFSYFFIQTSLLFFLNEFLGDKFYLFGYEAVVNILAGKDWTMSPRFPRVTVCDFNLRQMTNVQRWTLQCVLPINLYNELMFIILWFWFTMLSILSFGNFLYALLATAVPVNKTEFTKKYLLFNNVDQTVSRSEFPRLVARFVNHYLKADGVFLLKLITKNSQTTEVNDLVKYLWEDFHIRYYNFRPKRIPVPGRHEGAATLPLVNGAGRMTHRYREYYL